MHRALHFCIWSKPYSGSGNVARHVKDVVLNTQLLLPDGIKLRVNQNPAFLFAIPIFNERVILIETRIEIVAEPITHPRRNALCTKQRYQQLGEVMAYANQTFAWLTLLGQRRTVYLLNSGEQLIGFTYV